MVDTFEVVRIDVVERGRGDGQPLELAAGLDNAPGDVAANVTGGVDAPAIVANLGYTVDASDAFETRRGVDAIGLQPHHRGAAENLAHQVGDASHQSDLASGEERDAIADRFDDIEQM